MAHEAVLSAWPPLTQAIGDAAALRTRATVEQAAADWTQAGRSDAYLRERDRILAATTLLATALPTGQTLLPSPRPGLLCRHRLGSADPPPAAPVEGQVQLSPAAAAFLQAGLQRAEAAQRRARRRRIQAFTALSVLLVLTLVAAGIAVTQRNTAQQQQKMAVARGLIPQADAARGTDPRTALLLGIAAHRLHSSPETQASLVNTLTSTHYAGSLSGHTGIVFAVAFAPDGRTLATSSTDQTAILWDLVELNDFRNRPVQHACTLTGRGLNHDEWAQYVSGLSYRDTCAP